MDIVLKKNGNDIDSYKNADGIIVPATVDTDIIITSNCSVVKFPSPTTIYASIKKEAIGKDKIKEMSDNGNYQEFVDEAIKWVEDKINTLTNELDMLKA